jgi:UDP-N-acetylmuramyl-tripeptide synthetase
MGIQKTAVLPLEDANFAYFDNFPSDRKVTYGISKGIIRSADSVLKADGSRFSIIIPNDEVALHLRLPGQFNIRNALAAAAAAVSFGINLKAIKKGLEAETEIPGRLEIIRAGQPFTTIVDYAHTPDSLEKLLSLFRQLTTGKIFLVFGATGGGRDKSKRPLMGAVANKYADTIIVTDDDPYTEDRMTIIRHVAEGIKRKEGEGLWCIRDRREAIRMALSLAREGDTVLIAGKGCEPIQIIGEEKVEWDDRKVVREILSTDLKVAL